VQAQAQALALAVMLLRRAARGAASAVARQLRHGVPPGSSACVAAPAAAAVEPSVAREQSRRCAGRQGSAAACSPLQQRRGYAAGSDLLVDAEAATPARVRGEKDASGRALLDARTLAFLSARGYGPPAAVEALLRRRGNGGSRFPHETAAAAHAWFTLALGGGDGDGASSSESESSDDGTDTHADAPREDAPLSTVDRMVHKWPTLLTLSTERLEENWAFVQAPVSAGGLGLSSRVAVRAVVTFPQFFSYTPARMRARVEQLQAMGLGDVTQALGRHLALLSKSTAGLDTKCALLRRAGLDVGKLISAQPALLSCSEENVAAKLSFLFAVARCTPEDVQNSPVLLLLSLEGRTRPRFFVALQQGVVSRFKLSSCVQLVDARFIQRILAGTPAANWSVEQYRAHAASPAFRAWAAEREAELRASYSGAQ
jgi:hypothetical protein